MKVCVYGIGHLGSVTAAGLASLGHEVTAVDLQEYPVGEPGVDLGRVRTGVIENASDTEVLWVTFDIPVDDDGKAGLDFVLGKIRAVMPIVGVSTPVIISSQLPVGTVRRLEAEFPGHWFFYSPENLRHGTAMKNFLEPDRIVVGFRDPGGPEVGEPYSRVQFLLLSIVHTSAKLVGMSPESAEVTKHAINAWMAMSICFANEIAAVCARVGADPKDVERGLRSEERIGRKAYIRAGGPYEGKTLARDLEYLRSIADFYGLRLPLLTSIKGSNDTHRERSS